MNRFFAFKKDILQTVNAHQLNSILMHQVVWQLLTVYN